jgi:hypothetical protein
MSATRSGYRYLVLYLVNLEDKCSHPPKKPPMEEEKRDDGASDSIKFFLKESLTQQRNEMKDNFSEILQ